MQVNVVVPVDLEDLAVGLNDTLTHESMLEFILTLDSYAADYEFTQRLRDSLTEALELEDEASD
jgi:hypothetical protein